MQPIRAARQAVAGRPARTGLAAALVVALVAALAALVPAGAAGATTGTTVTIAVPPGATYWTQAFVKVTVTADSGSNPTSGTVTISDSFVDFSCQLDLDGSDQTGCPGSYTSVGTDTFSAVYAGAGGYAGSSTSQQVAVAQQSETMQFNVLPVAVGQTTVVNVTSSPVLGPNDSGVLTISDTDGSIECSTSLIGNSAECASSAFTEAGEDTITASWAGNSDYEPASISTSIDIAPATTVVASVTAPATSVGQPATITVQVQPTPDGGKVSVSDADGQVSGCSSLTVSTSTGKAVCTTAALTAADPSDELSAQYLGDADYAGSGVTTGSLVINRGTTQVTVAGDPAPSVDSTATYVATVVPTAAAALGGTVDFSDSLSPPEVVGCSSQTLDTTTAEASCTSQTYTSVSTDSVSATFSGNSNWAPASGESTFGVGPDTPTVSVALSPARPTVGEEVTILTTVSPSDGGGTVDFSGSYISGCGSVPLSGTTARCTTATLTTIGQWTIDAAYSGDSNFDPAGASHTATIGTALTEILLTSNPADPQAFSPTTLTAAITPPPDGGTVTFSGPDGTLAGCSAAPVDTATGEATCAVAELPGAGLDDLSASYSGDTDYQASYGQLSLLVAKVQTSVELSPSPATVEAGGTSTLTISVTPPPDGGTVTVTDAYDEVSCSGVAVATSGAGAGTATCSTGGLTPAGTDGLSVSYSGDSDYTATSGIGSISVVRVPSTLSVVDPPPNAVFGEDMSLTVHVAPPPASGTVRFSDSLGQLGACSSVSVDPADGDATCVSAPLTSSGGDTITITFPQTPTEATSSIVTSVPIYQPPSYSGALEATVTVGTASDAVLPVAGYPTPAVSASAALPAGLDLSASGVLSGTPSPGSGGSYSIGVSATNVLSSANGVLELAVDQAPSISSPTDLSAT
ncbi:MAG TPA: Ig-like domain repeat protein, partial [Acidimicrobiales bacterium]|nr:Ig-like domain repeat protein [Acidimicrobiales bacterium]